MGCEYSYGLSESRCISCHISPSEARETKVIECMRENLFFDFLTEWIACPLAAMLHLGVF